jgi:hypothetical protein
MPLREGLRRVTLRGTAHALDRQRSAAQPPARRDARRRLAAAAAETAAGAETAAEDLGGSVTGRLAAARAGLGYVVSLKRHCMRCLVRAHASAGL